MAVANDDRGREEWWQKWRLLRALYHPLLVATKEEFRRSKHQRKEADSEGDLSKELFDDAERTIAPYRKLASEFVGYKDIVDEILSSVHYWVFDDEEFKSICVAPPPKVFILKGSSGTGKTSLVYAAMVRAFEQGKARGVPLRVSSVSPSSVYEKWWGESEKKLAAAFDDAFTRPTVLFIDEAHSLTHSHGDEKPDDSGMIAYSGVQATLLEKVNDLVNQERRCILIMASNEFGSMLEAVRRRGSSGTIDLDAEGDRGVLLAVAERNIERYGLKDLDAEGVLKTIEAKVRALGHTTVTPGDIANAFQIVMEKKTKAARLSYIRRISSAITKEPLSVQVTLDDFRGIRQLKEYNEGKRSEEIRQIVSKIRPKITLDQVGGLSGVKEQLLKDIEISLNHEYARRAGSTPIHGILLHGPPGCGKTWLAQAIAGELDATVYMVRGSQVFKPYHGQTEKVITDMFDEARKNAPSIIIIDEVDALTLKRDMGGALGAVTTLLSEMGGLKPLEGVVVVATTNKLQLVDEAFLRAGRFDRVVEIPPPKNDQERKEIIGVHLDRCEPFLDKSVTPDSVIELLGRRTFTPARMERLVSDAIELRMKELNAVSKLTQVYDSGNREKLEKVQRIYEDDIVRVKANLGFSALGNGLDGSLPSEIKGITPDSYKLSLYHFRAAVEMTKDKSLEEIQSVTLSLRGPDPEPTIGKVYGLAALSTPGGGGTTASEGTVAVIECVCNPYARRGRSVVIGSEVAKSVRASAEHARVFLNEECDWAIRDFEFFMDFITFAKGLDTQVIQGPSAGAAITLAQYSMAAREPVLPNVVVTGGVTPRGELVQVGGLDFRGMGKFVAALNTEGVDTIVIPQGNFKMLADEDRNFFEKQGLDVVPARDFWDVARVALASHPTREQALARLASAANSRRGPPPSADRTDRQGAA